MTSQATAPDLPIGRFPKSKSLDGNGASLAVRWTGDFHRMYIRAITAIVLLATYSSASFSQTPNAEKRIQVHALQTKYEITGPIGYPIGQLLDIEATSEWRQAKVSNTWLRVNTVNGKALEKPVLVEYSIYQWANVKQLEHGKKLKLRVYQDIGTRGTPNGVGQETTPVSSGWPYGLYTWIVVVNQLEPKELAFRNTYYDRAVEASPVAPPIFEK
jgi:hypothetical protein